MLLSTTAILNGGLDIVTRALAVQPGRAITMENYECEARGYRSFAGYERFDGQAKPSAATYWVLDFDSGSAAILAGDTVTGLTSGETGVALVDGVLEAGTYGGGDATGYLVLHSVGTTGFIDNEALQVAAVTRAIADGTESAGGAPTDALNASYIATETARRRALITAVPGSGPVRGSAMLGDDVYAFRDNAGATACVMHKASGAGWVAQTFGEQLPFVSGTAEFLEGETVTGTTSGATATIDRVIKSDGAWSGTAQGWLVISSIAGGPFNASEAITSASGAATTNGANAALTLPAGGRYTFEHHNFYGAAESVRLYFANGVGNAWEWDGTIASPIYTGLASSIEKPTHIAEFKNHLFLGYSEGLIQNSSIGEPLEFDTTTGAGSHAFGRGITNLIPSTSTVLAITGIGRVGYIIGSSVADFELKTLSDESGAKAYTAAKLTDLTYLDNRGIRAMAAVEATGGFRTGTKSQAIEPLFKFKEQTGVVPIGAMRVRSRDIYRIFYDDGTGIALYIGGKDPQPSTFRLEHTPYSVTSAQDSAGDERLFFGTTDGFLMEMELGTSFDAEDITSLIRFPFDSMGAPQTDKRYAKAVIEIDAPNDITLEVAAEYGWGDPNLPGGAFGTYTIPGSGGFWDEVFWDQFVWSSQVQGVVEARLAGIGENVSIALRSVSAVQSPHTLSSLTLFYSWRRTKR